MGSDEADTPSKSEKPSSPAQEQSNVKEHTNVQEHTNVHAYPNWAAVQAYYGPGVNLPPPYFNSAAGPPHPYMWGAPQPLMPPYGTPYAAIYPPGGVYAHPSFLGSHSQGLGGSSPSVASEAMGVTPVSTATPAKSSSNKDQSFIKKLKGLSGNAVSVGNVNSGSSAASHSGDCGTEGSSDGSDENTAGRGDQSQRKRICDGMQSAGKAVGAVGFPIEKVKAVTVTTPPALVAEVRSQNGLASGFLTKDERELKRERRKQSNRESARRSRLRKQAEAEELAVKVEALNAENLALRSEINQLAANSEKLRHENASLMEKLKSAQLEGAEAVNSTGTKPQEGQPMSTENFLSRVENSLSNTKDTEIETENDEHSNSGTKLHQLLEKSPRTDAVAAS